MFFLGSWKVEVLGCWVVEAFSCLDFGLLGDSFHWMCSQLTPHNKQLKPHLTFNELIHHYVLAPHTWHLTPGTSHLIAYLLKAQKLPHSATAFDSSR